MQQQLFALNSGGSIYLAINCVIHIFAKNLKMFLKILIITVIFIGIAFSAIAIKMFVKKDGEFKKQCSTVDPATGKKIGCTCGGAEKGNICHNKSEENGRRKIEGIINNS